MTKIIAISGKKGSGKTYLANGLVSYLKKKKKKVKRYSFAAKIKELAIELYGLPREVVYGTDADKNSTYTNILWENMPIFTSKDVECAQNGANILKDSKTGYLTVREFLQFFGTEVMRSMFNDVWISYLMTKIKEDGCDYAIIDDCRFVNEANVIAAISNSEIVKLSRGNTSDKHSSETDIDKIKETILLDNINMKKLESKKKLIERLGL